MKPKRKHPKPNLYDIAQVKQNAVRRTIILAEYVLQSKHGFDRDQIVEFLENMTYVAEAIEEGRLNLKDIEEANKQEVHLSITSSTNN